MNQDVKFFLTALALVQNVSSKALFVLNPEERPEKLA
jgi:hypothetical protein